MRIIILIQVLFLSYSLKAQEGDGFLMTGKNTSRTEIEKRILKLDKVQTANLDSVKLGFYYMHKASLYLYSGRDSAFILLQKALELNRKNVCGVLWRVRRTQYKEGNNKWFIPDLNVPNIDSFMVSKCGQSWIDAIDESKIDRKPTTYKSEIAKRIMLNDQRYRVNKEVDWQKQNRLDSLNRIFVDSLYLAKGTLNGFNREETDAISFVIHHSNDCYWVLRWLQIWLSEYHNGKFDGAGMVIGPAFNRMLMNENAYCIDKLPDLSKVFLERIKKEFPKEVGIRFGYIKEE
jgi:hypothetical protein